MMSSAQVLAPSLQKTLSYDPVRDFTAISLAASSTYLVVVHPSMPAQSLAELIARAKAQPDRINYASSGVGAGPHLATELFASMSGLKLHHVPYRGDAPALADLVAGQVDMAFMSIAATLPQIQAGKLRALATAGTQRTTLLPDLPTVAEAGVPGYSIASWWGLVAPAGTPRPIVERVERVVRPLLMSPAVRDRFIELGFEVGDKALGAFDAYVATEPSSSPTSCGAPAFSPNERFRHDRDHGRGRGRQLCRRHAVAGRRDRGADRFLAGACREDLRRRSGHRRRPRAR